MFAAFSKALAQCSDPAFRGVMLRALAISTAAFLLVWGLAGLLVWWSGGLLLDWLTAKGVTGIWQDVLEWVVGGAGVAGVLFASFFLFPAVTALVLSFLLDPVAAAVEQRHYPGRPPARRPPIGEAIRAGLAFAAVTVALNLLALPFYILLLFVPPFNLLLFYGLNGYLIGREYFEIVAFRRMDDVAAKKLRRRYRGRTFMAGAAIALLLTIPLINLFAPVVGTAFMVHTFEGLRRRGGLAAAA